MPRRGIITLPSGSTGYTSCRILHGGLINSTFITGTINKPEAPSLDLPVPVIHTSYTPPVLTHLDLKDIQRTKKMLHKAEIQVHFSHNVTNSVDSLRRESTSLFSLISITFGSLSVSTWCILFVLAYIVIIIVFHNQPLLLCLIFLHTQQKYFLIMCIPQHYDATLLLSDILPLFPVFQQIILFLFARLPSFLQSMNKFPLGASSCTGGGRRYFTRLYPVPCHTMVPSSFSLFLYFFSFSFPFSATKCRLTLSFDDIH